MGRPSKTAISFHRHGALQAANVLNSEQANKMSVFIIRAFVRLREMALKNEKLARKVNELEHLVSDHDEILMELIKEIRKLIETPKAGKKGHIGFLKSSKAIK